MTRAAFLLAVLATGSATPAGLMAQVSDTTNMRGALASVRQGGVTEAAVALLTQERQSRSPRELDAFADSLVVIATSYRRGDPRDQRRAALAASAALLAAAHPGVLSERAQRLAERGLGPPVPYPRAFEALVRVFDHEQDVGVSGGTLYLITQLPDAGRVLAFLADVAASPDHGTAPEAIRYLSMEMGEAGLVVLRRLYETDAVVDPTAREHLQALAHVHGWSR
jgi:hypothetical protein